MYIYFVTGSSPCLEYTLLTQVIKEHMLSFNEVWHHVDLNACAAQMSDFGDNSNNKREK